jgi:tight adherence protein C
MPFVFAAVVGFYLFVFNDFGLLPCRRCAPAWSRLVIGYYAPNIYISNASPRSAASRSCRPSPTRWTCC